MTDPDLVERILELERTVEELNTRPMLFTAYEDLRTPALATKFGGLSDPDWVQFQDDGAASTGIYLYAFSDTVEEELFFVVQMPHGYIEGTDIDPHIHWVPDGNGVAGRVVCWGLEYGWRNIGADFGNTTIISSITHFPADAALVDNRHYRTNLPDIAGAGQTISSMLVCRLFRDATAALRADDYAHDTFLLEFDFHFKVNSLGSRDHDTK